MKAQDNLQAALDTFRQRAKVYGDSYLRHGRIMKVLFPGGIIIESEIEFNRFGVINMIVSKLCRYAQNVEKPHLDSVHDIIVYAAILEELDAAYIAMKEDSLVNGDQE